MDKDILLKRIREGLPLSNGDQRRLLLSLSVPAMLSQLSTIIEEYVDAMMVGQMGASASASIGLVGTTIWLLGGLSHSATAGFYVQVAHRIGAGDFRGARDVFRQGIFTCLLWCLLLVTIGIVVSPWLPQWLGAEASLWHDATLYFSIFCLSMPLHQMCSLAGGVLRSAGHVKVPALLQVLSCVLNIGFNYVFIFQLGLGVMGAAIGTVAAELVVSSTLTWWAVAKCPMTRLSLEPHASFRPERHVMRRAFHIAGPMAVEHAMMSGAQIVSTLIVAPLGTIALAANSFGIIVESLCYMPGFGIADAATTLVGQSLGAKREPLAERFARLTVVSGVCIMTCMGVLMYVMADFVMQFMTPDLAVRTLTATVLRIEALIEPLYAVSIVCYGVFVGAGDTKIPCTLNLASIWVVRIPLAAYLSVTMGLIGVWIAMAIELCVRGFLFFYRLQRKVWLCSYPAN